MSTERPGELRGARSGDFGTVHGARGSARDEMCRQQACLRSRGERPWGTGEDHGIDDEELAHGASRRPRPGLLQGALAQRHRATAEQAAASGRRFDRLPLDLGGPLDRGAPLLGAQLGLVPTLDGYSRKPQPAVHSIEHGSVLDSDTIALMKRRGTYRA